MKKWYNKGVKELNEKEIYLISLIEQDVEKLNEFVKGNGFDNGKKAILENLYSSGMSVEDIVNYTDLSINEIEELIKE